MLKQLFDRISPKKRRSKARAELKRRILEHVGKHGFLELNSENLGNLKAGRKFAYSVIYEMVKLELVHMRCDTEGGVVIMSNNEFSTLLRQRAAISRETEIRRKNGDHILVGQHKMTPEDKETAMAETVTVEMYVDTVETPAPAVNVPATANEMGCRIFAQADGDSESERRYGWVEIHTPKFALEMDADEEKVPVKRQTLPERRREPWEAVEETAVEQE